MVPRDGWDVVFSPPGGLTLGTGEKVETIYVELKNKHNTMNSASSGKTYIKMQNQLLVDDNCSCFLVEAIAKKTQDIKWETTVDKRKVSHSRIRRVSIDKFYEIVTGQDDAFYKICMALPKTISEILNDSAFSPTPKDLVYSQLKKSALKFSDLSEDESMVLSMYLLGFGNYTSFNK